MDQPTNTRIVPEGTRLGWSDTGYALLALMNKSIMVNSTPTDKPGHGGVALIAPLLRVVSIDRHDAEWGIAMIFANGGRVVIPLDGFRGSLVSGTAEAPDLTVVSDHDTVSLRVV